LGTFYVRQWNGPLGTLQRYFSAIRTGDQATMNRLVMPSDFSPAAERLPGYSNAVNIHFIGWRRFGDNFYVRVGVVGPTPYGYWMRPVTWVLTQTKDGWKVNIRLTNAANPGAGQ
jgi:hypothetical protein